MIYLLLNENGQISIIICTDFEVGILHVKILTLQTSILKKKCLTLLYSERPKLLRVLAILSAIELH